MNEIDLIAQKYAAAVYAKDLNAFLALYDPDMVSFDMWDAWTYKGRDAWAEMVKGWFRSLGEDSVGVSFTPIFCTIAAGWASWGAIVRYAGLDLSGTELRFLENRITWVLQGGTGAWRIVHEHSSSPADFKTGAVSLRYTRA
jgi:ketosteroid isomerase-like protein